MALLIFYQVTFVSNYHEGGAERPLANLSAVNYGNLPSCLSASAAGLPFVSKSKAPICNIGTFSFLQGQGAHKRLTTGDIYSRRSLRPPLQNAAHSSTWAKPTTWLGSTKPKPVRSGTGTSLCLSSGPACAGVQRAWVTKGGEDKKVQKHTNTAPLLRWINLELWDIWLGFIFKWHKAPEKRWKTNFLVLLYEYLHYFICSIYANVATFTVLLTQTTTCMKGSL